MNILAIIAHPSDSSLCHSILEKSLNISKDEEYSIIIRDLYKINFNPILTSKDLNSYRNGDVSEDIRIEQEFIANADLVIFLYPIWWGGLPAILKGYIDRVFSLNFAYKIENETPIPLLSDKKTICISTQGESKEKYESNGMFTSMENIFVNGIFSFCGINLVKSIYFEEIKSYDEKILSNKLSEIKNVLKKCETF